MDRVYDQSKLELLNELDRRVEDGIIEKSNADLLKKLIQNAETLTEAIAIAELGTTYKRTGFHFDKRLEITKDAIKYLKKNENLSFSDGSDSAPNKLIIGDNYDALLNLLIQYKGKIDVIYIDPPYGKDSMGEFAQTNYENAITRDNLLSMLYPRLFISKQLLSPSGVIFVSIDDKNQAYVKCLMDEVFGESAFLFNVSRITKKGGKSTQTIAKNSDYILAYTLSTDIQFSQEEKTDLSKYKYEDEFVETRGKYALSQTLDYNSLQYSQTMDYEIVMDGRSFYPGGTKAGMIERHAGKHGKTDWVWRWSKSAVEWGIKQKLFVIKNDRIYTKSYLNCRKKNGKNELETIDATKSYTTLSFIDNKYSNDNGKKELDKIFENGSQLFKNPKPSALIYELVKMVCPDKEAIVLDFFAGSGTTGEAVLKLNLEDPGNRRFILCQINEITPENPNGIAYDVTTKRLKRTMTGSCYDGSTDFKWIKDNAPLGGSLDVYEIAEVANFESVPGQTAFDVIDETLYGQERFSALKEKIEWVCRNFEGTQKILVSDADWKKRPEEDK
ncbi:MAG: site-specific DNA-methyltransferase [Clostridia bacterium]|nr:site-specific DNA-methyltransferase [Clostridia bacterium]